MRIKRWLASSRASEMNPMRWFLCNLAFFALFMPQDLAAQETEYRMEIGGGVAAVSALTDVNSKLFGNMTVGGGGVLRFLLNPRMAMKVSLSYARLKGNTNGVKEFYPVQPGVAGTERLNFKVSGALYDLGGVYEINFLPYGYTMGYQGYHRLVPYLQLGIGMTYSDAGKAFTMNVPMGLGLKYKVGERINLGLDWVMHFSLSDKLEGLEAPSGIKSSGFRNKDHYATLFMTVTYDISPRCPNCNKD